MTLGPGQPPLLPSRPLASLAAVDSWLVMMVRKEGLLVEIELWLDGLPLQLLKMLKEGWADEH